MTSGLGIGIGTVNVVSARVAGPGRRPVVRTRRTAVGFDSGGTARLGGITRFSTAVNEFADLGRDPDPVYVDGRIFSPTTIFASVVRDLVTAEPAAAVVATHPAGYTAKQLDLLRQSLDLAGAGHVRLVPEPVAAVHWLDTEHGPLEKGFVLVYDLGGNSLDVAVVRTGPDRPDHPLVGEPVRSYEFGGRPLGALIARCAGDRAIGPAEPGTGAVSLVSFVNPEGLRREHVRDSLEVVRAAVRAAGVALSDIARVLVVGGAARPPQVAETLAELGLPVTLAADSGQCVALGAAVMAAESVAPTGPARLGHPPIFSGAALFSAVAMSAATLLGNGTAETGLPEPERPPARSPGAVLYEIHGEAQVERSASGWSVSYAPLGTPARIAPAGVARLYGPAMPGRHNAPAHPRTIRPAAPDRHEAPSAEHPWPEPSPGAPAEFGDPVPFGPPRLPLPVSPGAEPDGPGTPGSPGGHAPGEQPGGEQSGGEQPGGGHPGGETDSGAGPGRWWPDGGASPGPGDFGAPGGDRPGGGGWYPGSGWSPPGGTPAPGTGTEDTGDPGPDGDDRGANGDDPGGPWSSGGDTGPGGTTSGGSRPDFSGRNSDSSRGGSGVPGGFGGPGGSRVGGFRGGSDAGGSDTAGASRSSEPGGSRSSDGGSSRGGSSRGGSSRGSHR